MKIAILCTLAGLALAACGACGAGASGPTAVSTACSVYAARNHLDPAVACDGAPPKQGDAGAIGR